MVKRRTPLPPSELGGSADWNGFGGQRRSFWGLLGPHAALDGLSSVANGASLGQRRSFWGLLGPHAALDGLSSVANGASLGQRRMFSFER